jgi:broad specificity phosphatase PhoE
MAVWVLVRHGHAGSRRRWDGPDDLRPLSKRGWRQAKKLVPVLGDKPIERVLSSPYARCVQSVEPLAEALGLEVGTVDELAEGTNDRPVDLDGATALLRGLAGTTSVLCSHGDVLLALLHTLAKQDAPEGLPGKDPPCAKGSVWELEEVDGRVKTARYVPPPA